MVLLIKYVYILKSLYIVYKTNIIIIRVVNVKLWSGKQIKSRAVKGVAITETQMADEVLASLKAKYKSVYDQHHFYHRGHGKWAKKEK